MRKAREKNENGEKEGAEKEEEEKGKEEKEEREEAIKKKEEKNENISLNVTTILSATNASPFPFSISLSC